MRHHHVRTTNVRRIAPVRYLVCVSVRARSSAAAPTPQNLTYGRRTSGWHQNSSSSRSSGSEKRNQSLSRRVAARTLCGPPAEIRQGPSPPVDGV